jgi:ubiquinone/menaquinone biosynthesis C-methylase UbiE
MLLPGKMMSTAKRDRAKARKRSDREAPSGLKTVTGDEAYDILLELAALKPKDRVLDLACGNGGLTFQLAARCAYVTGVDTSEDRIALASERAIASGADNVSFQVGDPQHLEFPDGMLDKALCHGGIHSFEQPGAVITEMARVVKPTGHVVISDIVTSEDPAWREAHTRIERSRLSSVISLLSPSQLRDVLSAAGLSLERERHWQTRVRFTDWMRQAEADRSTIDRTRRLLQEGARKKTTDLEITVEDQAVEFSHRWMACLALKLL